MRINMGFRRNAVSSLGRGWRAMAAVDSAGTRVGSWQHGPQQIGRQAIHADLPDRLNATVCIRAISSSARRRGTVKMSFLEDDGNVIEVEAEHGKSLLEVAHDNDVDLEGACGGDLACSTCHVILPQEYYDKLGEKQEEEDDMLDLAWGLTDTSRLGCQIKVSPDLEGMVIKIPEDTIDMR